jgi:hypothetical protein
VTQLHCVDHQNPSAREREDHQFKEIAGCVWSGQQVAGRVIAELHPGERLLVGVSDVVVTDAVTPSR